MQRSESFRDESHNFPLCNILVDWRKKIQYSFTQIKRLTFKLNTKYDI